MMSEVLAGLVLAACAVLLLRLAVGARRRHRLDAGVARATRWLRHGTLGAWERASARRQAANEAKEAIDRAKLRSADHDGNVIRPRQFQDKPRKPH